MTGNPHGESNQPIPEVQFNPPWFINWNSIHCRKWIELKLIDSMAGLINWLPDWVAFGINSFPLAFAFWFVEDWNWINQTEEIQFINEIQQSKPNKQCAEMANANNGMKQSQFRQNFERN